MAAQVEVQTGEVGRPVAGGRLHLSPLTDSSNKSIESPQINQSHIITPEPNKPVLGPKPRLTPKPFSMEKKPTIKPILAPKPQPKPRPESTRLVGTKPELLSSPKPQQPVATGKPRPVSTNPKRPAPTTFKTYNKLNTSQIAKPAVQPFKPAPPFDPEDLRKPTPPIPTERQKTGPKSLAYSKSLKKIPVAEWPRTTKMENEKDQVTSSKAGAPITRTKSMGSLHQVYQEEEEEKEKAEAVVAVTLRPQPRTSRPRPVSAIFFDNPTKIETPVPAPRWGGRRPLSTDLTSKFESIGLSLHRKTSKANTKENTPEQEALLQKKTPKSITSQSPDDAAKPAISDQSDKNTEEQTVKETDENKRGASIKSRISLLLDSSSSPAAGATGEGLDLNSPAQVVPEIEPPVGVKQLIKQLTEDVTPTQSPTMKPALKPRPLPLDLTKRFLTERSPDLGCTSLVPGHEISKDPQKRTEESAFTPSDQYILDLTDSQEQLKKASTAEGPEAIQTFFKVSSEESGLASEVQTVRASLFENVVERHSVLVVDEAKPANKELFSSNTSFKRHFSEDEGTLVTATYKEPIPPSSPLRVVHAFDTVQAVEETRAVSENIPIAHWEDKAMTLRSRGSEGYRVASEMTGSTHGEPALGATPAQHARYLRIGALQKWTTTDFEKDADIGKGTQMESQREVALCKDRDKQKEAVQEEIVEEPKPLKRRHTEEQGKPKATYFALTAQIQEPIFPVDSGANKGGMTSLFDDFSVSSLLASSQGKILSVKRNPSLDEAFGKTFNPQNNVEESVIRGQLSHKVIRSVSDGQTTEEMMEVEKNKEVKIKELEREKQRQLVLDQQSHLEFARMKEREMQREFERQRQKAFEKEKQEFEEKEQGQRQIELEKQKLREFKREKPKEMEREMLLQFEQERKLELERQRERVCKQERERQKQREEDRQRELDKEKHLLEIQNEKQRREMLEKFKELEKQQLLEFEKQKQNEKERQEALELEKQRQREKIEREEAEKIKKMMALEHEMLRLKELDKEKETQREMEKERQKELEWEKQRELERQRQKDLERERQRQLDIERKELENQRLIQHELEKERQRKEELEAIKEVERRQLLLFEKQKLAERERQQTLELEKHRQREKMEREEAEKIKLMALEQEMLRLKELDKEKERQREMEKERQKELEWEKQRELERQRQKDLERERQRQLDIERKELENQRLRQQELEKERQRKEELEAIKEVERRELLLFEKQKLAERERQQTLELEKQRREKMEKEEAEKIRQTAKQQEAERMRLKEEQERARSMSSPLRPKVVDLDSVFQNDPLSKAAPQRSDPATRWKEPSLRAEESYKSSILDMDCFMSQTQLPQRNNLLSVSNIQGNYTGFGNKLQPAPERDVSWKLPPQTSVGFSSPVWTSPQDSWELWSNEMSVDKPESRMHANNVSPEQLLFRQQERQLSPHSHWPTLLDQAPILDPFSKTKTSSPPAMGVSSSDPAELIWLPREPQCQDSRAEVQRRRKPHGSQELNRMRSRSVSRRSAPSSSALEGNLPRLRSRSAHRERNYHNWVQEKQSVRDETEGKDSETPVHDTDSQYGTWETGLRTDDSLTPATPSSESYLSPSPRKPTPPHTPGEHGLQSETDTLDSLLTSSENQPLCFPDAPTTLLDTSALRSRAQLAKKRTPRTRPSRAARQSAALAEGVEGTTEDWLYRDSTEAKIASQGNDSDSEEQNKDADISPAIASQPQRIALFPGMDPSALKAHLKKRGDSDNQIDGPSPSPSQLSRSPKSPFLPRVACVLPTPGGKENSEEASPQWLKELKSKKRLSQFESES